MRKVVLVAAAALLLGACGGSDPGPLLVGLPYSDYAHDGEPFAKDLYTEQAERVPTRPDPELFFVEADVDGRFTHVDALARTTPGSVTGAPVVWFFGGSTMFGTGQRDAHTVAAEIARLAADAGTPIDARNYGVSGYVAWQEAGLFHRLWASDPHPDLIVFLHGVNDFSQVCRHLAAGIAPGTHTNPMTDEPIGEEPVVDCMEEPESSGKAIATVVETAVADVEATAGAVPVVEFWQAMPQARKPHPSDDELLDRLDETRVSFDAAAAVYRAAIAADPDGIDLTDAFDRYPGPLFFDWAHTNEKGAQMAAAAMWDRSLEQQVRDLR